MILSLADRGCEMEKRLSHVGYQAMELDRSRQKELVGGNEMIGKKRLRREEKQQATCGNAQGGVAVGEDPAVDGEFRMCQPGQNATVRSECLESGDWDNWKDCRLQAEDQRKETKKWMAVRKPTRIYENACQLSLQQMLTDSDPSTKH